MTENPNNLESLLIREVMGELTDTEQDQLASELAGSPELRARLEVFRSTMHAVEKGLTIEAEAGERPMLSDERKNALDQAISASAGVHANDDQERLATDKPREAVNSASLPISPKKAKVPFWTTRRIMFYAASLAVCVLLIGIIVVASAEKQDVAGAARAAASTPQAVPVPMASLSLKPAASPMDSESAKRVNINLTDKADVNAFDSVSAGKLAQADDLQRGDENYAGAFQRQVTSSSSSNASAAPAADPSTAGGSAYGGGSGGRGGKDTPFKGSSKPAFLGKVQTNNQTLKSQDRSLGMESGIDPAEARKGIDQESDLRPKAKTAENRRSLGLDQPSIDHAEATVAGNDKSDSDTDKSAGLRDGFAIAGAIPSGQAGQAASQLQSQIQNSDAAKAERQSVEAEEKGRTIAQSPAATHADWGILQKKSPNDDDRRISERLTLDSDKGEPAELPAPASPVSSVPSVPAGMKAATDLKLGAGESGSDRLKRLKQPVSDEEQDALAKKEIAMVETPSADRNNNRDSASAKAQTFASTPAAAPAAIVAAKPSSAGSGKKSPQSSSTADGQKDEQDTTKVLGYRQKLTNIRRAVETVDKDSSRAAADEQATGLTEAMAALYQVPAAAVNPWVMTEKDPLSTFSLQADTASYVMARDFLKRGYVPPAGVMRMEEFINAMDYNYPRTPEGGAAFGIYSQGGPSPFRMPEKLAEDFGGSFPSLIKVGIKGRVIGRDGRKASNLVFAIDTSGSMATPERLPLVVSAIKMLVAQLDPADRVSIVSFSTRANLVLEDVAADQKDTINQTLDALRCEGSTNLVEGLSVAYDIASRHFASGRVNHVILCTDGVANIGDQDAEAILAKVADRRVQGISITTVGVGGGAYNDQMLDKLAHKGDGSYLFLDGVDEAKRVFVDNLSATLQTIAYDAKIQVEFDPKVIRRFRLIGYESRTLKHEDFRNDAVQAGEIGSGQSATALYEVEFLDPGATAGQDLGTVYVRYKDADTRQVRELSQRLRADLIDKKSLSDPRFMLAASAAEYSELLRKSPYATDGSYGRIARTLQKVCEQLPLDTKARELLWMAQTTASLQSK